MENINVKITIKSNEEKTSYEVNASYDKEKEYIYYVEKDDLKTVAIFSYKENILKRDNEKMYLELNFVNNKKTTNTMTLKDLNQTSYIELFTNKIVKNK